MSAACGDSREVGEGGERVWGSYGGVTARWPLIDCERAFLQPACTILRSIVKEDGVVATLELVWMGSSDDVRVWQVDLARNTVSVSNCWMKCQVKCQINWQPRGYQAQESAKIRPIKDYN